MNGKIDEGSVNYDRALASDYERLLGTKLDPAGRERLWRIKDKFNLKNDDFWWKFFFVLEHYESLYEAIPAEIESVGSGLVKKLTSISAETTQKVLEDARELCADNLAARKRFSEVEHTYRQAARKEHREQLEDLDKKLAAQIKVDVSGKAVELIMSSIRGELTRMTSEAAAARVALEIKNRSTLLDTFSFVVYAITATSFDVWSWIVNPHIGLIAVPVSIIVGAFIASISIARPYIARIRK